MGLPELWFVIVAVLWTGFFFLEGFDFGVGMLARTLGSDEAERAQMLTAIGPVWDADEVWLARSSFSQRNTDKPRPAASAAMPTPLIPPPITATS
mgnify:CR=1 FL=1